MPYGILSIELSQDQRFRIKKEKHQESLTEKSEQKIIQQLKPTGSSCGISRAFNYLCPKCGGNLVRDEHSFSTNLFDPDYYFCPCCKSKFSIGGTIPLNEAMKPRNIRLSAFHTNPEIFARKIFADKSKTIAEERMGEIISFENICVIVINTTRGYMVTDILRLD